MCIARSIAVFLPDGGNKGFPGVMAALFRFLDKGDVHALERLDLSRVMPQSLEYDHAAVDAADFVLRYREVIIKARQADLADEQGVDGIGNRRLQLARAKDQALSLQGLFHDPPPLRPGFGGAPAAVKHLVPGGHV